MKKKIKLPNKPEEREGYILRLESRNMLSVWFWVYVPVHNCDKNIEAKNMIIMGKHGWKMDQAVSAFDIDAITFCCFCGEKLDIMKKRVEVEK